MNETYDMPIPEPPATPEASLAQPDSTTGISVDPLCRMLGNLETSIERQVSRSNMYTDPLGRALDEVEASIEHHDHVRNPVTEELYEVLCDLEYKIEHQPPVPAEPKPVLQEDASLPEQKSFSQVISNDERRPLIPSFSRSETTDREPSLPRRYPRPTYRMTGQSTGIRNSGRGIVWHCNMRSERVTPDECDSCDDFEEADFTDDDGNVRCRHSFPNASEGQDKNVNENSDSDEPTDE
jgi:hypothetical protein